MTDFWSHKIGFRAYISNTRSRIEVVTEGATRTKRCPTPLQVLDRIPPLKEVNAQWG